MYGNWLILLSKGYARGCGVVKKRHNFAHFDKKWSLIYLPRVADLGILRATT